MHPMFESALRTAAAERGLITRSKPGQLPEAAASLLLVDPDRWPWDNPHVGPNRKAELARATALILLEWERIDGS
jgi:hypothetical protein